MTRLAAAILLACAAASPASAQAYSGAELRTTAAYLYGKFETRMRSTAGNGVLSSFFTYSDASYPAWNEVDVEILGRYGNEIQINHITGKSGGAVHHVYEHPVDFNPHETFNTYGFEWYPDSLLFFVNGKMFYRAMVAVKELTFPQKIMMNIWISDNVNWVGPFSPAVLPAYAYYDWVSYATYTPGKGPGGSNFTPSWKEDFNQANPPGWEKASHTFEGNLTRFAPANASIQGGMAVICLTEKGKEGFKGTLPDLNTAILRRSIRDPGQGVPRQEFHWFRLDGRRSKSLSLYMPTNPIHAP